MVYIQVTYGLLQLHTVLCVCTVYNVHTHVCSHMQPYAILSHLEHIVLMKHAEHIQSVLFSLNLDEQLKLQIQNTHNVN